MIAVHKTFQSLVKTDDSNWYNICRSAMSALESAQGTSGTSSGLENPSGEAAAKEKLGDPEPTGPQGGTDPLRLDLQKLACNKINLPTTIRGKRRTL